MLAVLAYATAARLDECSILVFIILVLYEGIAQSQPLATTSLNASLFTVLSLFVLVE